MRCNCKQNLNVSIYLVSLIVQCFYPHIVTLPEIIHNAETGETSVHSTRRKQFPIKALPVSVTFAVFEE